MATEQPAKTILVVEDNLISREGLGIILRRSGYTVVAAEQGQQALDLLQSGLRPDLILLDMLMPVLDGWHFLDRLKTMPHGSAPVVITTGTMLDRAWAAEHGCTGFVRKPIDPDDLLAEVQRVLDDE